MKEVQSTTKEGYEIRRYHHQETFTEQLGRWMDSALIDMPDFLRSFVPSVGWVPRYRRDWLVGDLISGFTVGVMTVPQAVAYTRLAGLPVQYGLYSAFMSNMVYSVFGGVREVAMGPNAVLCLMTADIIKNVMAAGDGSYSPEQIATSLAVIVGFVSIVLGSLRLGIILDFIPSPVILGFTAGAACTVMMSQFQAMLGIPNVNTSQPAWVILKDLALNFKNLSPPDAYMGTCTLLFLFAIPFLATKTKSRILGFAAIAVNAIAVILFTVVSLLLHKLQPDIAMKVVGAVPSGFGRIGMPELSGQLLHDMLPYIPGLILLNTIDHTAVSKNFSSKAGYTVSISQELLAIGLANFVGSIFSGFTVAGSLSRGAVLQRSGVKTPMAGMFIGLILFASLAFLTPAFYYIPTASLGAIIMRAGMSLLPEVRGLRELLRINRSDFLVFSVAACVTYLFGVQYGMGCAIALAFVNLIFRIARPKCYVLGEVVGRQGVFVDKRHPAYTSEDPEPGVIVFRVQESIIFPNIGHLREKLMDHVCEFTRSGAPPTDDKLWSSDNEERATRLRYRRAAHDGTPVPDPDSLPTLRGVILDLGAVNYIDASGIQGLKELRDQLYLYAGAHPSQITISLDQEMGVQTNQFELHFVSIHTKILRALVISGLPHSLHPPRNVFSQQPHKSSATSKPRILIDATDDVIELEMPSGSSEGSWEEPMEELTTTFLSPQERLEPIVMNSSPFIHLTVHAAVECFRNSHLSHKSSISTLHNSS
ncbi:hypothetical protein DSO57_1000361 [Entomophthora muscae]|uniref:Uncharacterized protein n=1 Tax=Entomophthora muscae TaxID=34485 RepID=A0ACC2TKR5_9FUNG|nr:hypothetical protein DSO57_1000361 [Entomophthora muscae]